MFTRADLNLCLVDTRLVIEFLGGNETPLRNLVQRLKGNNSIIALSVFTAIELRRHENLWETFITWLANFPTVFLKTTHMLLDAEMEAYPNPSKIDPILFAPYAIEPEKDQSKRDSLSAVFNDPEMRLLFDELSMSGKDIVDSIKERVPHFPIPEGSSPTDYASKFVERLCLQQVTRRNLAWFEGLGTAAKTFNQNSFPSIKAAGYSAYFRFYVDREREHRDSDLYDLINASALPYMNSAVLGPVQAAMVRQRLAAVDPFLENLDVITLNELV